MCDPDRKPFVIEYHSRPYGRPPVILGPDGRPVRPELVDDEPTPQTPKVRP